MAPHSSRTARRRRPTRSVRLRCEQFEDRVTPALFTVQPVYAPTGANNNGFVLSADFNKDGRSDAVLTNYGPSETSTTGNSILLLIRNTSGGFSRAELPTLGTNVSFAAVGDINGDTWPDLVVSNANTQNAGTITVFQNVSGNLIRIGTPFSTFGNNASWVGLTDMTNDGILDVVVANFGKKVGTDTIVGNNITVFQGLVDGTGHGNFTFSSSPITTLAPQTLGINAFVPTALAVADFDGDNIKDIAGVTAGIPPDFGLPYPEGSVYIFKGNGSGFGTPIAVDTGGVLPVNIQAADLNGDTKKDLIIANAGDPNGTPEWDGTSVGVLMNISTGGTLGFGIANPLEFNCTGTFAVAVSDFNIDGNMDIASINYGGQGGIPPTFVSVYMGNGTGGFVPGTPPTYSSLSGLPGGQYLAVGDFDANGSPDLITASFFGRVDVLLNTTVAAQAPRVASTQVNDGSAQRSRVTSLTVTFNAQVTFATTAGAAFTLTRVSDGASVAFTATPSVIGGVTVVTINNFTGSATQFGSLADGRYTLTALANQISANGQPLDGDGNGTGGDNYVFGEAQGLFRFYGDINGDRHVDIADFGQFSSTFFLNQGQTGFNAAFDFNGDGHIDIADFGQFSTRLFAPLP